MLAVTVALLGPALTALPIDVLRVLIGALLLIFGLQWLSKAILRFTNTYIQCRYFRIIELLNGSPDGIALCQQH